MLCTRPWKAEPWGRWGFPPPPLLVSWFGFSLFFFSFLLSVGLGSFGTILVSSGSHEESRVLVVSPLSIVSKFHLGTFKNRTKQQQKRRKLPPFSVLLQELIPGGEGDGGDTGMLLEKQTTRTHKQKTSTQTLIVATERCVLCSAPLRHPTSSTAGAAVEMFPPGWRGGGGTVVRCHFGNVTGEMLPKERKTGAGAAGSVLGNQRAAPALPRSLSGIAVSVVSTWQAT